MSWVGEGRRGPLSANTSFRDADLCILESTRFMPSSSTQVKGAEQQRVCESKKKEES